MDIYKIINKELIEENVKLRQQIDCLRREIVLERQRSVEKNEELVFVKMSSKEKALELLKIVAPDMSINGDVNKRNTDVYSLSNNVSRSSDESRRFSSNISVKCRRSSEIAEELRHSCAVMRSSNPILISPTRCSSPMNKCDTNDIIDEEDPNQSILENESNTIVQDNSAMDISNLESDNEEETESEQEIESPKEEVANNNELYSILEDSELSSELESNYADSIIDCESSETQTANEGIKYKQIEFLLPPTLARTPKNSSPLRNVTNQRTPTLKNCKNTRQCDAVGLWKERSLQSKEISSKTENENTLPEIQIERHAMECCDNLSFGDSPSFLLKAQSTPQTHRISIPNGHNATETNATDTTEPLLEFNLKISSFDYDLDSIGLREKQSIENVDFKFKKNNKCQQKNKIKKESVQSKSNATITAKSEVGSSDDESSNCSRSSRPMRACRPTYLCEPKLKTKMRRNM